jgi:hypothetical protein
MTRNNKRKEGEGKLSVGTRGKSPPTPTHSMAPLPKEISAIEEEDEEDNEEEEGGKRVTHAPSSEILDPPLSPRHNPPPVHEAPVAPDDAELENDEGMQPELVAPQLQKLIYLLMKIQRVLILKWKIIWEECKCRPTSFLGLMLMLMLMALI